jgi:uncharacterized membrane protein
LNIDSLDRLRGSLTLLVLLAALAALGAAELGAPAAVRLPLGLLATLLLPGMAVAAVCFPRIEELSGAERGGLAVAMSLALVVVTALLLSYTPWGLSSQAVLLTVSGATVLLSIAGIARQRALASDRVALPASGPAVSASLSRRSWLAAGGIGLVFAILAGALLTLRLEPRAPAAQFYLLGPNGLLQDYPVNVQAGEPLVLTPTLDDEPAGTYTVTALHDGAVLGQTSASLATGQMWQPRLSITLPAAGDDQRVDVELRQNGSPSLYRTLTLWLNASP